MNKKHPMRILDGVARPYEPFWSLRNAADSESGETELDFYGPISEFSWFGDEITPALFKADLYRAGDGGPVTIRINSAGGDVIAASVIRSTIVDYPGRVTVRIDGLCASAATFVAIAGDVVKMQDTGYFMIHDPWTFAWGTVDELRATIDLLKTVKEAIIEAYLTKSSLPADKLSKMMNDETWMSAKVAQEYGFVDEVIGGKRPPLQGAANAALLNYVNLPEALQVYLQPAPPVEQQAAEKRLRAEAKLFCGG